MKPIFHKVLVEAVEAGANYGVRRFYKHRDDVPGEDILQGIADSVAAEVINSFYEWFEDDLQEQPGPLARPAGAAEPMVGVFVLGAEDDVMDVEGD